MTLLKRTGPVYTTIIKKLEERIQEAEKDFAIGKKALEEELKTKTTNLLEEVVAKILK